MGVREGERDKQREQERAIQRDWEEETPRRKYREIAETMTKRESDRCIYIYIYI